MTAGESAGECVLAIDIGTQSTRAALVGYSGQILGTSASPVRLFAPRPGWAEQDPEEWWSTTLSNVATVVAGHPNVQIAAMAVGAQMHGLVALDGEGRAIGGRSAIWSDKRCADQVEEFKTRSDAITLATVAGNRPLPAWAGFKMAWLRHHRPDTYARAAKLLVVKDFVNHRLCGQLATDPSEASGSFLCDAATGQWSDELVDAIGIERSKLPQIVSSTTVIGGLGTDVAGATGLLAGTPVVAGSGDMMCQLLGAGLTDSGRVALVAGTASILAMAADRPSPDLRVMNLRSATGNWAQFGIADAAGVSLRWFIDQFCPSPRQLGPAEPELLGRPFDRLTKEAAEVEAGSDGLLFFPYLLGERTLGTDRSRASFIGATLRHQRRHFVRAVLEGITLEDRRSLDCVCPDGIDEPVRCTGGGATSSLWNQIRADVFGHPVQTLTATEGGIQGAAILAGVGAGWYANAAAGADQVVRAAQTWSPDPGTARLYDRAYRTFCEVHDVLGQAWRRWDESSPG
jgi:xylulokinase